MKSLIIDIKTLVFLTSIILITPITAKSALELTIDALSFKADSGRAYVELHFDLPRALITFSKDDDNQAYFGALKFEVLIQNDSVSLARDEWRLEDIAETKEQVISGQHIVDTRIYQMFAGDYQALVTITDSISGNKTFYNKHFNVPSYPDSVFSFSDVQLAIHIVEGNVHPRFNRGEFSIIPNPRRLFAPPTPIFFYLEIYPASGDNLEREYTLERSILSSSQTILNELPPIVRRGSAPFAVIDTIPTADLSGDTYYLQLKITCGDLSSTRTSKFFIYQPGGSRTALIPQIYDSAAVLDEFAQVEFLLTREQVAQAIKMSVSEKGWFLERFWKRYDDDPETPEVPLRKVFRTRVAEADARWTNSRSPGHQSDRGRIYVVHGEPDDREIHTLDLHAKPYEIWTYNSLQGGVIFAFVDRSALGEFTLVHSTFRGEVFNPDWYDIFVIKSGLDSHK